MDDQQYAFLKELIETPSPSGYEQPVQRVIRRQLEGVADELRTDMMGNLIARIAGADGTPRIMLTGHCDEIGFMLRYIDDQGFLYFAPIGGVDAHLVPGQRVHVHTASGPLLGVIGKKPIHLMEAKDKETVLKFKEMFIDIGCSSREEAQQRVAVGDPVTIAVGLARLLGDRITGRAFDDKMGAFVVARVLQEVRRRGNLPPVDLYGVSTVQEELGLRGAVTSAYEVRPDLAIIVEVGFATDFPGVEKKEVGEFKVDGGPILSRGANINHALFELLVRTADQEKIPVQVIGEPRATGTDANVVQISRRGVATAIVRVPLRYMHTPVEVLSLADLDHAIRLLTAVLYQIPGREAFVPN
ncbi:MAG: M42 family metallopeptidase [Desulfuromonadales bacterium]|nr:M42 family metallopeptidase [Desulfuromonadales bacterium]